ncbi:MAG: hypothetical protein NWQ09_08825 [Nonlabens sp.]|nr:hypothetical protein [Nonlabens sp.]
MKNFPLLIACILLIACNDSKKKTATAPEEVPAAERATFNYKGPLLKVNEAPKTCDFLNVEHLKKWYNLEEIKFLTAPMNAGPENSCTTTFYAKDGQASLSLQLFAYNTVADFNAEANRYNDIQSAQVIPGIGESSFWYSEANFIPKSLVTFYKGLKIAVVAPPKDVYTEEQQKNRSIQVMKEYLATF